MLSENSSEMERKYKKLIDDLIKIRRSLRSLYKDHCFNEALSLPLRLELYRRCDDPIPDSIEEIKQWSTRTKKFTRKLKSRLRRLARRGAGQTRKKLA